MIPTNEQFEALCSALGETIGGVARKYPPYTVIAVIFTLVDCADKAGAETGMHFITKTELIDGVLKRGGDVEDAIAFCDELIEVGGFRPGVIH